MRNLPGSLTTARDPAVDLVKTIAMVMVIVLHCCNFFSLSYRFSLSQALHTISLPAVPLFFMASGYVLLGRSADLADYRYALRKVWRIVRFLFLFSGCVYAFIYTFGDPEQSYLATLYSGIRGLGILFMLWFLAALAIVYLIYPPLNRLWLRHHSTGPVTLIALIVMIGLWVADAFFGFAANMWQCLRLWNWVGFFILGGAMQRIMLPRSWLLAATPLLMALMIWSTYFLYNHTRWHFGEFLYSSPQLILYACCIFQLCLESDIRPSRALSAVSQLFLPVYVIHPFVIWYLVDYIPWSAPGSCIGLTASTLIITVFVSWLIMKIRPLRAIFTL